jgi:AhpC/TSA family protein
MFMRRLVRYTVFVLALGIAGAWAAAQPEESATPAKEYQALSKEFQTAAAAFWQATTAEETNKIVAKVDKLPLQILELVEKNPKDPIALDALIQVISQEYWLNAHTSHPGWGKESRQSRAITLILRDHLQSDKLGEACRRIHYGFRQECETFLRTVMEKSPHREVQGLACLALAQFLPSRIEKLDLLPNQPELARRYELLYGKDYLEALRRQDRAGVIREAETLYEQAIAKYGDVKLPYEGTVRETATRELYEIRYLAVGKEAPDIEGVDQEGQQFKLSDYRGKVVLLYFWSEF